jgi:hypothetical protein
MKIYDCFTFNNELDLLELRLEEMSSSVDYFVVVEANHTFQGSPKSLHLKNNWDRYSKWHNQIIHVVVEDMPNDGNAWHNEHHQRNSIMRGLVSAADDDFIIVGDVDEILRAATVDSLRTDPRDLVGFRMPYFNFRLNYMLLKDKETYHVWTVGSRKKYLVPNPESFRNRRFGLQGLSYGFDDGRTQVCEHAGWHFTYLGNTDWVRDKIRSFAHSELNRQDVLDQINVEDMMNKGVGFNPLNPLPFIKVKLDDYFPATLIADTIKYADYITTGGTESAREYLPKE